MSVHGDRVQGQRTQLFQQAALVLGDHALGHGLVQLALEIQRLALALQRLEELAPTGSAMIALLR